MLCEVDPAAIGLPYGEDLIRLHPKFRYYGLVCDSHISFVKVRHWGRIAFAYYAKNALARRTDVIVLDDLEAFRRRVAWARMQARHRKVRRHLRRAARRA